MDEWLDGCVNECKNAMSEARVSTRRNKRKEKKKAFFYILTTEGNGTPFQYPCLENPMDRGAW